MNNLARCLRLLLVTVLSVQVFFGPGVRANELAADAPELFIQSVRIRGNEFIMLQNASAEPLQLEQYKLHYFNHFDANAATTSKLLSLSSAMLPPGASFMMSDEPVYACESMIVSGESLGFTDSNGLLQLVKQVQNDKGGPIHFEVVDNFAWSSKASEASSDVHTQLTNTSDFFWRIRFDESSNPEDADSLLPQKDWHWVQAKLSPDNVCEVTIVQQEDADENTPQPKLARLTRTPTSGPPSQIVYALEENSSQSSAANKQPVYPARSIGLESPQLSELLPNPGSPNTDADHEYIELYNSNDAVFELSNFSVRFGTKTVREYTFPDGTLIEPKSFAVFYSADANFALTNNEGRVQLIDPYGNVIDATDVYSNAKDNQSWVIAEGAWQWSTTPTPGAANSVSVVAAASKTQKNSTSNETSASGAVQGSNSSSAQNQAPQPLTEVSQQDSLHPFVLATFGSLTVGYALYEYRQDITNKVDQFRRYRASRRTNRTSTSGR